MKSIASIFIVLMIFTAIFVAIGSVGEEVYNNEHITADSKKLIVSFNDRLGENFNYTEDFEESGGNLSVNSTFDSEDVFAQQFLEGKQESQKKQGLIKSITKLPDLIILSVGVEEDDVKVFKGLALLIIVVLSGFAIFRLAFGPGKVTDN